MTKSGKTQQPGSPGKTEARSRSLGTSSQYVKSSRPTLTQSEKNSEEVDSFQVKDVGSVDPVSEKSSVADVAAYDDDAVIKAARESGIVIPLPDPTKPIEDQDEYVLAAMAAHGEARGEGLVGMALCVQVAVNRKNDPTQRRYLGCAPDGDTTLVDVLLHPYAFSCFNENDPNRGKLLKPNKGRWVDAAIAAAAVLSGTLPDPTDGATHYHTIKKPPGAKTWPPKWESHPKMVKTISHKRHVFYREEV